MFSRESPKLAASDGKNLYTNKNERNGIMEKEVLTKLERLNQLRLDDAQREEVLAFFEKQDEEIEKLYTVHTEQVERMVHVMPVMTVVREDIENKLFTREELQQGAPEAADGYWQVPRLLE